MIDSIPLWCFVGVVVLLVGMWRIVTTDRD